MSGDTRNILNPKQQTIIPGFSLNDPSMDFEYCNYK